MGARTPTLRTTPRALEEAGLLGGVWLDRIVAAAAGWLVGGMWLDAWAHHSVSSTLETFFTPWHGVLYSGLLAMMSVLSAALVRGRVARALGVAAGPARHPVIAMKGGAR